MGRQNRELFKNIELYEQKKKAEQQESKIYGQKSVAGKTDKRKKINVYHQKRS